MVVVVSPGQILRGLRQRLEVAFNDGVDEHAGVFVRVSGRHVDDVRLHDHRPVASGRWVESRHRPVIRQPVVAPDDAEAYDVALVV